MGKIARALEGKNLLVLGSTGFLGQPLVEKILYSCPDVRRIYVLIRPQHQLGGRVVTAQARLEKELYASSVFDRLRASLGASEVDKFLRRKLVGVAGDISRTHLDIDPETFEHLRKSVDIVINSAAVVSFDAPIDQALELNVLAARRVARFAAECERAILIHVSTAYVRGATTKAAFETFYHSADPATPEEFPEGRFKDVDREVDHIKGLVKEVYDEAKLPLRERQFKQQLVRKPHRPRAPRGRLRTRLEKIRARWIQARLVEVGMAWARQRGWNDTYTYTKALGEQMILKNRCQVPTVVLRPSVIESTLSEPCPGWLDGLRMADPLIVAIGKGRLRSLPLNPNVTIDLVPADVVVNALLASIPAIQGKDEVQIYQVATGSTNPITLGELYELIHRYFRKHPMLGNAGKPIRTRRLKFLNPKLFRIQHRLKSLPLHAAERTLAKLRSIESTHKAKRKIAARHLTHQKLYYYGEIYEPYLNLGCRFKVDRTAQLFTSLDPADQKEFNFDLARLNWRHYIQNVHIPGVKKFILKMEGAGTMELSGESHPGLRTIKDLLEFSASQFGAKPALQIKRKGEWVRYSYRRIEREAQGIAKRFQLLGLKKGERVLLFCENRPEWGIAFLGAMLQGLVVVPLDAQTWHREVWSTADFTEARALLVSRRTLQRLPEDGLAANEAAEQPRLLFDVGRLCSPFVDDRYPGSTRKEASAKERNLRPVRISPDDPVSTIFTQTTASDPKGAVHTHRNFLLNLFSVNQYLPLTPDDALLSVLPLYHALEFSCGFLMALYAGATVTYTNTLKPRSILETMRETGTSCLLGVPTLFALIRDDINRRVLGTSRSNLKARIVAGSKKISHSVERRFGKNIGRQLFARVHSEFGGRLRLLVSGGSALGQELYEDFRALGMTIYEGYGMTETAPVLTVNPENLSRPGSAGKPLPGIEVRLNHPDKDGIGEIVVRTPSLMLHYFKNPTATQKAVRDSWLYTGDLGWVDVDGYIYIAGRVKDVIVTGAGKNVYPLDLEAIYGQLPSIDDICTVGFKSGLTEEVHALVRPSPDAPSGRSQQEIREKVRSDIRELARELPSYHRLQQVHIWPDEIPSHADGQPDRQAVKELILQLIDSAQSRPAGQLQTPKTPKNRFLLELERLSGTPMEQIRPETDLFLDLGLDSLMAIELLLFLERELGVSLSDERAAALQQVREVFDHLQEKTGSRTRVEVKAAREDLVSTLPYLERAWLDRFLATISLRTLKRLFRWYLDLRTENADQIPCGVPYIIAANHNSHLDTAAVLAAVNWATDHNEARRLHVLGARDYFFKSPVKKWLVTRLLNVVPIERKENSLSSLRLVKRILAKGESVVIFPEGTRSREGNLQPFKPGLGLMAWELKVPVVPVFINGTFQAMPVGRSFPSPGKVRVTFGEPLRMEAYQQSANPLRRDQLYRLIVTDTRRRIARMQSRNGEKVAAKPDA